MVNKTTKTWTGRWTLNEMVSGDVEVIAFGDNGAPIRVAKVFGDMVPEWRENALAISAVPEMVDAIGNMVEVCNSADRHGIEWRDCFESAASDLRRALELATAR